MARTAAPWGICPQCKTRLETKRADDGRTYRECPRCGWDDLDIGGAPAPVEMTAPGEAAAKAKSRNCGCVVATFVVITLVGIIMLIISMSSK